MAIEREKRRRHSKEKIPVYFLTGSLEGDEGALAVGEKRK